MEKLTDKVPCGWGNWPQLADFFTDGEIKVVETEVEKEIDNAMEAVADKIEREQFEATQQSKKIFIQ